jgi:hypothetical protein
MHLKAGLPMNVASGRQGLHACKFVDGLNSICAPLAHEAEPRFREVQTDAGHRFCLPSSRCAGDARPWAGRIRGTCIAGLLLFLLVNMSGSGPSTAESAGHLHGAAETTPRAKYMAPMCAALGMLSHGIFNSMRKRPAMYRECCASRSAHRSVLVADLSLSAPASVPASAEAFGAAANIIAPHACRVISGIAADHSDSALSVARTGATRPLLSPHFASRVCRALVARGAGRWRFLLRQLAGPGESAADFPRVVHNDQRGCWLLAAAASLRYDPSPRTFVLTGACSCTTTPRTS